ncbi:MAG: hypothetical protein IH860_03020 [Chloroflexi bacterium]|nr:hypothetical protein [Chloroflexota bacterium]
MVMGLSKTVTSLDFNKVIKIAGPAIVPIVFVASVTAKERAAGILKMPTNLSELQTEGAKAIDIVVSRITGFSPLGTVIAPRTFRLKNLILNPYLWASLIAQFGAPLITTLLPGASKIVNPVKKLVLIAAVPGMIGAVFDDPPATTTTSHNSFDQPGLVSASMIKRLQVN